MPLNISGSIPSTGQLQNKVALVTGSARGIGRAVAIELGQRGAKVVVNYSKSSKQAEEVVKEIFEAGSEAIAVQADISKPEDVVLLFKSALSEFGRIDIVVSNSGAEHFGNIDEVTPEQFDHVFNLNTRGQFFVAQNAHKNLSHGGRLIMMSSISAHFGLKEHAVYAGSKNAVEAFARCFAKDFGDKKVTVNCVAPGGVDTDMCADAFWRYIPGADPSWTVQDNADFVAKRTPLQRMGMPQDISRVIAFLASDDAGWISGQTITISGGAAG